MLERGETTKKSKQGSSRSTSGKREAMQRLSQEYLAAELANDTARMAEIELMFKEQRNAD